MVIVKINGQTVGFVPMERSGAFRVKSQELFHPADRLHVVRFFAAIAS
jgi:hypothetical protein